MVLLELLKYEGVNRRESLERALPRMATHHFSDPIILYRKDAAPYISLTPQSISASTYFE